MWKNYLNTELRILRKQISYAVVNVLGLAVGIAACILILIYIRHELSYEDFHEQADNIYRLSFSIPDRADDQFLPNTPAIQPELISSQLPEVKQIVSFIPVGNKALSVDETRFVEKKGFYVSPNIFEVFSFSLRRGDMGRALASPNAIVITEQVAIKYFKTTDVIGRSIYLDNLLALKITGILDEVPPNSHLDFDFLISSMALGEYYQDAWSHQGYNYLHIHGNEEALKAKLNQYFYTNYLQATWYLPQIRLAIEPIKDIHLNPTAVSDQSNADARYLYIFATIALLILVTASINYVNLTTAMSSRRILEVGVRRVLGAEKSHLRMQFWIESLIISVIAMLIAVVLVFLALPQLNQLIDKQLSRMVILDPYIVLALILITVVVGLFSGAYPGLVMSNYKPIRALKEKITTSNRKFTMRRGLVLVQLAVSITLIISTLIISDQISFLRSKKLGFEKEQVVSIELHESRDMGALLRKSMLQVSGVVNASLAMGAPLNGGMLATIKSDGQELEVRTLPVDENYIETMGISLLEGRGFSEAFPSDSSSAIVINQMLADQLLIPDGKEELLGKPVPLYDEEQVIGIVNDFHTASLHNPMVPTALVLEPRFLSHLLVRIQPENVGETLTRLSEVWGEIVTATPFEYVFLDDSFDALYRNEQQASQILNIFAAIAIFITCLGLFALSALSAKQRTKEIGIRIAHGATLMDIIKLFTREFLILVGIAALIAIPVAYFAAQSWLASFAFHVQIGMSVFLLSALIIVVLMYLTVGYHAIKASHVNPVETLRYE